MATMGKNLNIVIEGPHLISVSGFIGILQGVSDLAKLMDQLREWNPDIAKQIKKCKWQKEGSRIDGLDFRLFGIRLIGHLISKGGAGSIECDSWPAAAFCIMEGCGLFVLKDVQHFQYYAFGKPTAPEPSKVIEATHRLLGTRDEDGFLHPERIISCANDSTANYAIDYLLEANTSEVSSIMKARRLSSDGIIMPIIQKQGRSL